MLKIFKADENFSYKEECVFILGGFDGVHLGHQKLIERAKSFGLPVGILTISGAKGEGELFTLAERERIFTSAGIDFVVEAAFSDSFKAMSAEDFISVVLNHIRVKAFVCGEDFRFGFGAAGDGALIARRTGLPVYIEPIALDGDKKISTGAIKKFIAEGNIEKANSLLAYGFSLSGAVVHGRAEGRKMGFPTVNMVYPEGKAILRSGVYGSSLYIDGKRYNGITNLGGAPTFGVEYVLLETYIDGFNGDMYGKYITIYPAFFMRDIKKFSSAEELKNQLGADIQLLRSKNL